MLMKRNNGATDLIAGAHVLFGHRRLQRGDERASFAVSGHDASSSSGTPILVWRCTPRCVRVLATQWSSGSKSGCDRRSRLHSMVRLSSTGSVAAGMRRAVGSVIATSSAPSSLCRSSVSVTIGEAMVAGSIEGSVLV
jgi:hypothetical protein